MNSDPVAHRPDDAASATWNATRCQQELAFAAALIACPAPAATTTA